MNKFTINFLWVIALGIIQVSFLTTWPLPVNSLNLILSVLIFLTVIIDYKQALWWAIGAGLFLELYSDIFFGIITLSLIITIIGINLLSNNFFTNRSLYSLVILGLAGTIFYNLIKVLLNLIVLVWGWQVGFSLPSFWLEFFWPSIFNVIILIVIFFAYQFSGGRLKNIFYSSKSL